MFRIEVLRATGPASLIRGVDRCNHSVRLVLDVGSPVSRPGRVGANGVDAGEGDAAACALALALAAAGGARVAEPAE
jgi:hypothetical protein